MKPPRVQYAPAASTSRETAYGSWHAISRRHVRDDDQPGNLEQLPYMPRRCCRISYDLPHQKRPLLERVWSRTTSTPTFFCSRVASPNQNPNQNQTHTT